MEKLRSSAYRVAADRDYSQNTTKTSCLLWPAGHQEAEAIEPAGKLDACDAM
jgi:hypothetical protein